MPPLQNNFGVNRATPQFSKPDALKPDKLIIPVKIPAVKMAEIK
jgi:hypothetical protein